MTRCAGAAIRGLAKATPESSAMAAASERAATITAGTDAAEAQAMHAFGTVYVEPDLGVVCMSRAVGTRAAGRNVSPRLAPGPCIDGIGRNPTEGTVLDPRYGRPVCARMAYDDPA
jgi:hypothetical protein